MRSLALLVGGSLLLLLGGVYVVQSVVRLLATWIPSWLASLLSDAALAAGGAVLRGWANANGNNVASSHKKQSTGCKRISHGSFIRSNPG